jgi:hypothetical protein
MCSYFLAIGDNAAEVRAAQERLMFYLRGVAPASINEKTPPPPHLAYLAELLKRVTAMQPEDLGERSIVTGDVERCVEILKQVEAAGIEETIIYFNFGAYPHADTVRMMERFARDVMPHFAPRPAASAAH